MPGNEVGDRVHNFFGQDNLPQGQQFEVVDRNWQGSANNLWGGTQRQNAFPPISNLKNYNAHQSDTELANGTSAFHATHGINFAQPNLRQDFNVSQFQNQQANGYLQGHNIFPARQNEDNIFGMDTGYDRQTLTSNGLPILAPQQGIGVELQKRNYARFPNIESPVNFHLHGNNEQMAGQHPVMFQSLQRQQSGISDMQLVQQQLMLKQLQDAQRQQFSQQQIWQQGSTNQLSSMAKQAAMDHSQSLLNGIPVHDTSNYSQNRLMPSSTNWLQPNASIPMPGSSSGPMLSPEQGQTLHLMESDSRRVDQSIYGLPPASRDSPSQTPNVHINNLDASTLGHSFLGNQHAAFSGRASVQNGPFVSRQVESTSTCLSTGFDSVSSRQESNERQEFAGLSETSQVKNSSLPASSQNVAALDPTEERILFGGDDNIWDAFGEGSNMGNCGFNSSDGAGLAGGLSSLQSGSWSALMQSALAETSSADTGPQEEWSGLSFRNTETAVGSQQPATINDNTRNQPRWSVSSPALNSRPSHLAGDMAASAGASNLSAFQQSDARVSQERSRNFQGNISRSFIQDRNKSLSSPSQKPSLEGNQIYANVINSTDVEAKNKFMSGAWVHPQSLASFNATGQSTDRPNGFKAVESVFPHDGASVRSPNSENSLHSSQSHSQNRGMKGEVGHETEQHKSVAFAGVGNGSEHAFGSSLSNRRDSTPDNASAMPHLNNFKASQEGSQQLPNVHGFDFWSRLSSSVCSEKSETPGGSHYPLDRSSQNLGSSGKNEIPERDSTHKEEDATASVHSNTFHNMGAADVSKENVWVDAGDMRHGRGSKQKLFSAVAQKPSVMRRFQYHPMGNIDIDEEYSEGTKSRALSQAMNQQARGLKIQDQGFRGNFVQAEMNTLQMHKDGEKIAEEPPKSMESHALSLDKSSGSFLPNQNSQPSQNMLELLHKVDQSRDPGATSRFSSSDRSDMNEAETSDCSVGQIQRNQSSASQIFGLQLAPPSQRVPNLDRALTSQSTSQRVSLSMLSSDGGEKGLITPFPPVKETSQVNSMNHAFMSGLTSNKASSDIQGNSCAFSLPKSRLQHVSGREAEGQSLGTSFNELASHSNQTESSNEGTQPGQCAVPPGSGDSATISHHNSGPATERTHPGSAYHVDPRYSAQQLQAVGVPQSSISSGLLLNMMPNLLSKDGSQQQSLSTFPGLSKGEQLKPPNQSYSGDGTTFSQVQKVQAEESQKGVRYSQISASTAKSQSGIGKGQAVKEISQPEELFENADSVQTNQQGNDSVQRREIEAFGRYLKPTNVLYSNYSLLHQVQAMKNTENDPNDSRLKGSNSPDCGPDPQQVTLRKEKNVVTSDVARDGQASIEHSSVTPGDPKLLTFAGKPRDNRHASMGPPNMVSSNSSFSKNPSHITDHPRISPQMAPSWFDQYGTFKNGHVLQIFDPQRIATLKQTEQAPVARKPAEDLQVGNSMDEATATLAAQSFGVGRNLSPIMKPMEAISAQHVPLSDASDQSLLSVKQKKRKSPIFEPHAWHKEVSEGARRLHDISVAEAEWGRATSRVIEKIESGLEIIEDRHPTLRPKRRLILTTQLMQQLFRPPPAAFLNGDAASHYENVVYFTARMSLGDSCTAICQSSDDAPVPNNGKSSYEKSEAPPRGNHPDLSSMMEGLVDRTKKLENELSRLDQRYSVFDLRMECQELEKFSLINRFAKLHARGQSDGTETMSSDAQKYVTAVPISRSLPDNVQCLSL